MKGLIVLLACHEYLAKIGKPIWFSCNFVDFRPRVSYGAVATLTCFLKHPIN